MTQENYNKAKTLQESIQELSEYIKQIEASIGTGDNLIAGVNVHISKQDIDWFVFVCKERINELKNRFEQL